MIIKNWVIKNGSEARIYIKSIIEEGEKYLVIFKSFEIFAF